MNEKKNGTGAVTPGRYNLRNLTLTGGLICAALALAGPLVGQEVQGTLSLDEALRLAKRNSPIFLSTQNDQSAADWRFRESMGAFLPTATSSISGQYLAPGTPSFGIFSSSDLGLDVTDYYFSSYSISLSYNISGSSFFQAANARATQKATEARIRAAEFDLESNVTAQYLVALRARDNAAVAQRALDRAMENEDLAMARVEVGAVIPTDGKQAEVERGRAEVVLLDAQSLYRSEKLRLLEQLGVEAEGDFELASEFQIFEPEWAREGLVSRALEGHPSLRSYRAQENAGKAGVRQAWSDYFPTVFVRASWSGNARQIGDKDYVLNQATGSLVGQRSNCLFWNEVSSGLATPLTGYPRNCDSEFLVPASNGEGYVLSDQARADVLANNQVFPFDFSPQPFSIFAQVSFPIFQGFGRQRQVAEARAQAEDARLNLKAEELGLQTAVTQAYDDLTTATQVVRIEERNREVAEEQLALAQERYRLGAAAYLELLEAQNSMAEAERDYLNAKYRFHGAIWALEAAVGERLRPDATSVR